MERKLKDIFDDVPESEVAKSSVEATVTKKKDDTTYEIEDDGLQKDLEIDAKFRDKIVVGERYRFFSPEKMSNDRLRLTKKSFPKKLFQSSHPKYLKLKDLLGKKDKTLVKEGLCVKVFGKLEEKVVAGKTMRLVYFT